MEFKKTNNRYDLKPKERVLKTVNEYGSIVPTKLSSLTKVNYMHLHSILQKLEQENLITIEKQQYSDMNVRLIKKKEDKDGN